MKQVVSVVFNHSERFIINDAAVHINIAYPGDTNLSEEEQKCRKSVRAITQDYATHQLLERAEIAFSKLYDECTQQSVSGYWGNTDHNLATVLADARDWQAQQAIAALQLVQAALSVATHIPVKFDKHEEL